MANDDNGKGKTILGTAGVLINFGLAKVSPKRSVRRLVKALLSDDEDTSTAAYMALVKLGPGYANEVALADEGAEASPKIAQILGDMGNRDLVPVLEEVARTADEETAAIARESIETLLDEDEESEI